MLSSYAWWMFSLHCIHHQPLHFRNSYRSAIEWNENTLKRREKSNETKLRIPRFGLVHFTSIIIFAFRVLFSPRILLVSSSYWVFIVLKGFFPVTSLPSKPTNNRFIHSFNVIFFHFGTIWIGWDCFVRVFILAWWVSEWVCAGYFIMVFIFCVHNKINNCNTLIHVNNHKHIQSECRRTLWATIKVNESL